MPERNLKAFAFAETINWFREIYEDRTTTALAGLVEAYFDARLSLPAGMATNFETGLVDLLRCMESEGESAWYRFELRTYGMLLELEVRLSLTHTGEEVQRILDRLERLYPEVPSTDNESDRPRLTVVPPASVVRE